VSLDRADLRCSACGGTFPSEFWFRSPNLCIECFARLPEAEKARVVAEYPVAPCYVPESERPIPELVMFRIPVFVELWILLGYIMMFWTAIYYVRLFGGVLWWSLLVILTEETTRFAWSYLRSPRRMEKRGRQLRLFFRNGTERTLPLDGLRFRGKWWQYGQPWMLQVLNREGRHEVNIWVFYFDNGEVLRRIASELERK
jgi:hypothetical protein